MGWPLVLVLLVSVCPSSPSICDFSQCNCTVIANKWINAVCAFNSTQKQLDISSEMLPRTLAELEVSGPREMVLLGGSFSRNLTGLSLVRLIDIGVLTVEKKAFARLAHPHLFLEVRGAQRVILESSAFYDLRGAAVSVSIERVERLIVQERAFNRLLALNISGAGLLELQPNAFYFMPDTGRESQGPVTRITFDRVKVKELPINVFPALNHLSITNSEISVVKSSAFRAMILTTVRLVNTTVGKVESEAFTTRSVIGLLELEGVTLGLIQSNSVQSGITHLVIRGSSLSDVSESAFHLVVASVSLSENMFNRVQSRGFTLKETTVLTVENNRFNILEESAFHLPERESNGQTINLTFRENSLGREIGRGALDFTRSNQIGTNVNNNRFDYQCECEDYTKTLLKEKINGSESVVDLFYTTSLCHINLDLTRCFSIPEGMFLMENFTALACDNGQYYCPEVVQSDYAVPAFPGVISDIVNKKAIDRERKVLGSILIFVISGIVLMLFFSGFMWLRRNGYCTKARLLLLPSADSMWNIISRMFVGPTSAPPGVPASHEYAELQQAQKQAEESAEDDVSLEDKATQTLPEELTQELLQSLREKLDDPDNYGEARDMIEHLYDLIKVEESCNQNSDFISLQLEELDEVQEGENIYDIIQPKTRTTNRSREKKSLVSVGTRVPSPDKLLPLSLTKRKPTVVCDYTEPKDRQLHLYQELQPSPSVLCDYTEPPDSKPHVYLELPTALANRPLPSKPDHRRSDPGEGTSSQ